jgi:hypothetical protein
MPLRYDSTTDPSTSIFSSFSAMNTPSAADAFPARKTPPKRGFPSSGGRI